MLLYKISLYKFSCLVFVLKYYKALQKLKDISRVYDVDSLLPFDSAYQGKKYTFVIFSKSRIFLLYMQRNMGLENLAWLVSVVPWIWVVHSLPSYFMFHKLNVTGIRFAVRLFDKDVISSTISHAEPWPLHIVNRIFLFCPQWELQRQRKYC